MAKDKITTQYGALPFAWRDGELQVLLITTRDTGRWLVPKGWPEKGMAPHQLAAHEAFEEAGITGKVSKHPVGSFEYLKRLEGRSAKRCRVMVFSLEVAEELADWPERDERRRQWMSPAEAAERIGEPELAGLILSFAEPLQSHRSRRRPA
jgi:8-oxo-dGTP pyrophosphatase MutT (NUDIX family)